MWLPITAMVVAPGLAWIWALLHWNRNQRPQFRLLLRLFLGGNLCGLLALLLNHLVEKYTRFWPGAPADFGILGWDWSLSRSGFWLLIGANEEFAKLVVLLLLSYVFGRLRNPAEGMVQAGAVALGFATIENAFYLDQYGPAVLITRTIITLPAHAFMSMPMGYLLGKSALRLYREDGAVPDQYREMWSVLGAWLVAFLLHGTYDLWLSLNHEVLAYAQIGGMALLSLWLLRRSQHEVPPLLTSSPA